mmetsp:Transcript_36609/g.66640  ORF Transcript_36609/g.66640 Transcript_36609/m.66640 type:complete len:89 (-) Transcript_36609:69-335(-)
MSTVVVTETSMDASLQLDINGVLPRLNASVHGRKLQTFWQNAKAAVPAIMSTVVATETSMDAFLQLDINGVLPRLNASVHGRKLQTLS